MFYSEKAIETAGMERKVFEAWIQKLGLKCVRLSLKCMVFAYKEGLVASVAGKTVGRQSSAVRPSRMVSVVKNHLI